MKRNSRLSVALHLLLHMTERPEAFVTSEQLADWAQSHPVVIRRTFAALREAGILSSTKGHGGGWRLARAPETISVGEIQSALDERLLGHLLAEESPGCLVERAVNDALAQAMAEAERLLNERLSHLTLADLAGQVSALWGLEPGSLKEHKHAL